jgi:hypothetical protein
MDNNKDKINKTTYARRSSLRKTKNFASFFPGLVLEMYSRFAKDAMLNKTVEKTNR